MRWLRLCLLGATALAYPSSAWAQDAILEDGKPALRFANRDTAYTTVVSLTEYRGEPAFRFAVRHDHAKDCRGFLYVTRTRLAYDPALTPRMTADAFDVARSDVAREMDFKNSRWSGSAFQVHLVSRTYKLDVRWAGPGGEGWGLLLSNQFFRFASLVFNDFAQGEAEFQQLTANLRPAPAPPASVPIKPAAEVVAPRPARIAMHTDPGGVQVYVDDVFKGSSSSEGRLVVEGLPAGSHRLRLTLIGFKEWTQSLELAAAEDRNIEAKLAPAGPKPLALPEIEEALTNGVSPKRVSTLVKQFGVDFPLTEEVERRLRAAGADSDLLLAIHLNKK